MCWLVICARDRVAGRLEQLLAVALPEVIDPETSVTGLMALWDGLGSGTVAALARPLVDDPWYFRGGWLDLTVVRDGEVRFIEVKTTDSLIVSQLDTFRELLMPLACSVSVLNLTPLRAPTRST